MEDEHVSFTDELVGSGAVEDGARVNHCRYAEGDTCGEVGFDGTGNNIRGGSLRGDDHVYAHGTSELCDTCNRELHLLAGGHDEVTKLVDDNHDIRHVLVSLFGVECTVNELLVILTQIAHTS